MPMDPALESILTGELAAGTRGAAALTGVVGQNLVQMGGVILENLTHQHGGTADDAATMAALRTSIFVPQKESGTP